MASDASIQKLVQILGTTLDRAPPDQFNAILGLISMTVPALGAAFLEITKRSRHGVITITVKPDKAKYWLRVMSSTTFLHEISAEEDSLILDV